MIKRIENSNELNSYQTIDLYSIRILSLLKAYGTGYDFATFYKQINDCGKITAIISKLDNDITISFSKPDFEELTEFIEIIGYSTCLCSGIDGYERSYEEGIVMATQHKVEFSLPYFTLDEYPNLMDLFNFNDYASTQFESWYVDVSHRIRHNCAKAYALKVNDEIVSSGIFSSIYNGSAILTSVQTVPEFRRLGYGTMLVSEMINDISGIVFLMRDKNLNESFYKKLGFINIGFWRMYK